MTPSPRAALWTRSGFGLRHPQGELVALSPFALRLRAARPLPAGEPLTIELESESKGERGQLTARPVAQVDGVTELRIEQLDPTLHREILRVAKAQLLCDGLRRPFDADGDAFVAASDETLKALHGAQLTFDQLHRGRPLRLAALARGADGALLLRLPQGLALPEARWSHACAAAAHESVALRGWLRPLAGDMAAFEVEALRVSAHAPEAAPPASAPVAIERLDEAPQRTTTLPDATPCAKVHFGDPARPLAGLLGETSGEGPRCAVVIPPAWGRTKESTALLAQALLASARAAGARVRVLRFDYADTLGESHQGEDRGAHEATRLRVSSCVADIRAAVAFAAQDAERVVLVGMSFSGPLCLRVAATEPKVSALVQLMGASDVQDLVRMATGGVDYVAEHMAGQSGGLRNVLGLLTDTALWCEDGLAQGLLRFPDALRDAARLPCPLTWVLGEHDAFVNPARVRRLVEACPAPRRLIQVPCGHVPSRTREALLSFWPLLQEVFGASAPLALPKEAALEAVIAQEWAQAPRTPLPALDDYWRGYMLGETEGALGFEVLGLTREYRQMMALQAALLDLSPGQTVHDVGGGLGHAMAPLREAAGGPITLHLYDLVPELLDAAAARAAGLGLQLHTRPWDAAQGPPPETQGAARVLLSLFLTVLDDPAAFLRALRAQLAPGAVLVASSICPDADLSKVYVQLLRDVREGRVTPPLGRSRAQLVQAIRDYIDAAAQLLRVAEEGRFRLYGPEALRALLEEAGFQVDAVRGAFGDPARAVVVRARVP